jgi:hypothetical protein
MKKERNTMDRDRLASALHNTLINECDSRAIDVVDGLFAIAEAIDRLGDQVGALARARSERHIWTVTRLRKTVR